MLIYIVEPLLIEGGEYAHTNQREIVELVSCLNGREFTVDVVDFRDNWHLKKMDWNHYKMVITIDDKNLYRVFEYKKEDTKVIYFATGANFLWNNPADISRVEEFKRHLSFLGIDTKKIGAQRIYNENYKKSILAFARLDGILCVGNEWTMSTYDAFGIPIYPVKISGFDFYQYNGSKNGKNSNFLWFGGSGMLHKGLDLCIEAFARRQQYKLYVAGYKDVYWEIYEKYFKLSNVEYVGFLNPKSVEFEQICSKCNFSILPSCSEGTATSVITTMYMGVIPIVTKETGIDVEKSGGFIIEKKVENICSVLDEAANLSYKTVYDMRNSAYQYVKNNHSLSAYKNSINDALDKISL